jgi:glycerol uptake facilitator-like aquaporin
VALWRQLLAELLGSAFLAAVVIGSGIAAQRHAAAYMPAQVVGCIGGVVAANLMFALPAVSISAKHRASPAHFLSEIIATLGLILVIFALGRSGRSRTAPAAVGAYIGAAYWRSRSARAQ